MRCVTNFRSWASRALVFVTVSLLATMSIAAIGPTRIDGPPAISNAGGPETGWPNQPQLRPLRIKRIFDNLVAGVDIDVATLVQVTHTYLFSPPSPDPTGIAYHSQSGTLLISDSEVDELPNLFTGANLFEVALNGALLGTASAMAFSDEPTGVAYDAEKNHLFFTDDSSVRRIYQLMPGPDGTLLTNDDVVTFTATAAFGSFDPEGLAFDSVHGHLFIADGVGGEVYELSPGPNQRFDGLPPQGDDWLVNQFDVDDYGIPDPEGIEFNHQNGNLYILSSDLPLIAETWRDGTLVRYIDISDAAPRSPSGLAYAPSSSGSAWGLYIVDRAVDNSGSPHENDGELYEMTIPAYSSDMPFLYLGLITVQ